MEQKKKKKIIIRNKFMKLKKFFFDICYMSTVVTIILALISLYFNSELMKQLFFSPIFILIRVVFMLLLFVLWIKCIMVWSRRDKKISIFFLLFFLHGFYILYYYRKIINNNWL